MYRCYLIRKGRIALGDDADGKTLAEALAHGRRLIASQSPGGTFSGFEIWDGASMVYGDTAYANDADPAVAIESPFQTAESTILPNWRPSLARPIVALPASIPLSADPVSVIREDGGPAAADAETSMIRRLVKAVRPRAVRDAVAA
jgi:hypothetical protein